MNNNERKANMCSIGCLCLTVQMKCMCEYGDNKATSKKRAQGDQIASAAGNQKS